MRTTEPGEGDLLIRRAGGERRSRPYRACQAGSMTQGYGCVTKWRGIDASISRRLGARRVGVTGSPAGGRRVRPSAGTRRTPSVASRGCGHPGEVVGGRGSGGEGQPTCQGVLNPGGSSGPFRFGLGPAHLIVVEGRWVPPHGVHLVPRLCRVLLCLVRPTEVEFAAAHHRRPRVLVLGRRIHAGRRWWPMRSRSPPVTSPPGRSARPPRPTRPLGYRAHLRSGPRAGAR